MDASNHTRRLMRVADAAAYLGVSAAYLNTLRCRGDGPVFISIGRAVAYVPDDLDRWIADRRRASTSDKGGVR